MLIPTQAKALLINLLLAASPHKDGLRDVITGRGYSLEPAFDNEGGVSALEFYLGAMILRSVEDKDQQPVTFVFLYADDEFDILYPSGRYTRGDGEGEWRWTREQRGD